MAKLRVFVSSTFYDLRHIRASMESFIESLGYDAVLHEKGAVTYKPDRPLDDSCIEEAQGCDIYVLIIGGRYGSESSASKLSPRRHSPATEAYESITLREFRAAQEKSIPCFILIDRSVFDEYQTFSKNKSRKGINFAFVDNVNVFVFIEEVLALPKNNPVQTFERFVDIEEWLKEQWSGYFKDFVRKRSQAAEVASIKAQITELAEISKTLKDYLELLLRKSGSPDVEGVIAEEHERLRMQKVEQMVIERIPDFAITRHLDTFLNTEVARNDFAGAIVRSRNFAEAWSKIGDLTGCASIRTLREAKDLFYVVNEIRKTVGEAALQSNWQPKFQSMLAGTQSKRYVGKEIAALEDSEAKAKRSHG